MIGAAAAGAHALEPSPFRMPSPKLAMWLFIVADAATFGALLFGYGYLRVASAGWPRPFAFAPTILNALAMTVVLVTSSLTMLLAVGAARTQRAAVAIRWMVVTALLGVLFAALHLREWAHMLAEGWRPSTNPIGAPPLFGGSFFAITGLHLLHVISGVIALLLTALAFRRDRLHAIHVETVGLYWHFVDLVWMFVFPLLYLMNAS